ncbi:hypothetical protein K493DRAFT_358793 [Basidiobolus meristosporus CBS 931.73]|uniref:Uncharacterized protein n=1 Tax=Basidiobolus meristosporus CBS 931.73 TaxID=1314790 RepID=A0A1Y1XU45_9FUNG|nr:hypothetical protein K493DRAFT_358793 [Basidiobolus meristosporus CBS 931.73]|eukprot:ORX89016.1 hypothetical protein K493DRAFT_358793 [Basidiobolus meristosporus CBS 931.73]
MEESPINKAHQHANAAEEFETRGLLEEAMKEHFNAAEHFEMAIEFTSEAEVIRTLQLLSSAHQRQGLEMERRINKNTSQRRSSADNGGEESFSKANSTAKALNILSSRYISNSTRFRSGQLHSSSTSPSHVFDDSFLVLKSNLQDEENKSDPFDRFWEAVEALIQNTSNPIAFATAPLEGMEKFDIEEIRGQYAKKNEGLVSELPETSNLHETLGSFIIVPEQSCKQKSTKRDSVEGDYESVIGSTKTIEEYAIENQHLKKAIDILSRQVNALEKAAEENTLLKSSIIQLRQDVQKQGKKGRLAPELSRIYGSKYSTGESQYVSSNAHTAITPQKKIQELEEEVRLLKLENEKQSMMLNKYRDRWDQLKESAKKKRSIAKTEQQRQPSGDTNDKPTVEEKAGYTSKNQTVSFAPSPTKSLDQSNIHIEASTDVIKSDVESSPERNSSTASEILSRSESADKSTGSMFYSTSEDMKSSFP